MISVRCWTLEKKRIVFLIPRRRYDNRLTCSTGMRHFANVTYDQTHPFVSFKYLNRLVMRRFFKTLSINFDYLVSDLKVFFLHIVYIFKTKIILKGETWNLIKQFFVSFTKSPARSATLSLSTPVT